MWTDLPRLVIERQWIEEGIADLDVGITWSSNEIRDKFKLSRCRPSGLIIATIRCESFDCVPTDWICQVDVTHLIAMRRALCAIEGHRCHLPDSGRRWWICPEYTKIPVSGGASCP